MPAAALLLLALVPLLALSLAALHLRQQGSQWSRRRAEVLSSALSLRESVRAALTAAATRAGSPLPVEPANALATVREELSYIIECLQTSAPSGLAVLLDRHMRALEAFERRIQRLEEEVAGQGGAP